MTSFALLGLVLFLLLSLTLLRRGLVARTEVTI
jgi:hypothetical protein